MRHIIGTCSAGLPTISDSNVIRVGTFLVSSNFTVSQLKFFTASTVSLRMESSASELNSFISDLIFAASFGTIALDKVGELTTLDAIDT